MKNRHRYLILLPLLIGFFVAQIVQASTAPAGSAANPVVSKQYMDKVLQPLRNEVVALEKEVAQLRAEQRIKFDDVPSSHWAYDSIMYMVEKNVVKGMTEKTFAPSSPTTRAQLAVMVVNALNLPVDGLSADFTDVAANHWAAKHIAAAQKAGIIQGHDGKFRPNDNVSRREMAAILVKAFRLERLNTAPEFKDVPQDWAYEAIMAVADHGISKGYPDSTFRPLNQITRAEVCVLLARSLEQGR